MICRCLEAFWRRALIVAVIGVFWLLPAGAATATGVKHPAAWPHEGSDLSADPAVQWGRLDNGLGYVLMANAIPRNRASIHLVVAVGSVHEDDGEQGMAHFLEHMVFNGSTHFKPGELVAYLQRLGMDFGPDANGSTSFDLTVYDLMLPDAGAVSVAEGLKVLDDYARGAWLLEEEIQRERGVVLAEKRSRDSSDYRTFEAGWQFKLPSTRVAARLPIGLEETLRRMDHAAMKRFYDTWYRPERMIVVVVGDVDLDQTRQAIAARFAGMVPRGPARPDPAFGRIAHKGIKAFYHHEPEAGQTTVSVEVVRQVSPQPDSIQRQQRLLAEQAAHRLLQHRLDRLARRPDAPFTEGEAAAGIFLNWLDHAHIEVRCRQDQWRQALGLVEQSLRAALTQGFATAEVERVKREMRAELEDAVKQAATRESADLARQLIASLSRNEVFSSPAQELALLGPMVAALDPERARQALSRIWASDHRLVIVSGNAVIAAPKGQTPAGKIRSTFTQSQAQPLAPTAQATGLSFPYLPQPAAPGPVTAQRRIDELGLEQIDYANGTRLNLKPTAFKTDEVLINLAFGQGRAAQPAGQPGLADLTEALVNEAGVGPLDRNALDAALAGTSTSLSLRVEEDRFVLAVRTVKHQVALAFQLLEAYFKDPAWRPEAFEVVIKRFRQNYAELGTTVDGALTLEAKRFLAGGDERFGLPPESAMMERTLDQVKAWLGPALAAAPLELSVVGDVNPDQVAELAALYLGSLERTGAWVPEAVRPVAGLPRGQSRRIDVPTRIDKAMVVVAFGTDDIWDIGRTRRLNLLADIFSEKLRDVIREKLGAAYSPYAFNRPSRAHAGHGLLQAMVTVAPDQAGMVRDEVLAIAADLAASPIGQDALVRAREPSLTRIRDHLQENPYWLQTVLTGSRDHPEQLDWARTILADYGAVAAEQVAELARRYLVPANSASVLILPRSQAKAD